LPDEFNEKVFIK